MPQSKEKTRTKPPPREFDRDEVMVCMVMALCLTGASTSIIYRLLV